MTLHANKRIMIVGGNKQFMYIIQRFVRASAHQIIFANLGEDILTRVQCEKPAAIVLEVDLPDTVGWHTLQSLKADPNTGRIPVIVCSWLDQEVRCLEHGADLYLRMPIMYTDFEVALTSILEERTR
jgi:CheY-like chemotaxis protein